MLLGVQQRLGVKFATFGNFFHWFAQGLAVSVMVVDDFKQVAALL